MYERVFLDCWVESLLMDVFEQLWYAMMEVVIAGWGG